MSLAAAEAAARLVAAEARPVRAVVLRAVFGVQDHERVAGQPAALQRFEDLPDAVVGLHDEVAVVAHPARAAELRRRAVGQVHLGPIRMGLLHERARTVIPLPPDGD